VEPRPRLSGRRAAAGVSVAVALLIVVLIALALNSRHDSHAGGPATSVDPGAGSNVTGGDTPTAPAGLSIEPTAGKSTFRATWKPVGAGDLYSVKIFSSERQLPTTKLTAVTFVLEPHETPCVEVTAQSPSGVIGAAAQGCPTKP
jgi:hypothetical protein